MKVFEVCYQVSDNIFTVNMIEAAHVNGHELEAVTETAERYAAHYYYKVAAIIELCDWHVAENRRRGMPYYSIDDAARKKYDTRAIAE